MQMKNEFFNSQLLGIRHGQLAAKLRTCCPGNHESQGNQETIHIVSITVHLCARKLILQSPMLKTAGVISLAMFTKFKKSFPGDSRKWFSGGIWEALGEWEFFIQVFNSGLLFCCFSHCLLIVPKNVSIWPMLSDKGNEQRRINYLGTIFLSK